MGAKMVRIRAEKTFAANLLPGELFVFNTECDTDWFKRELGREDVALPIFMRTNVTIEGVEDAGDTVVNRLIVSFVGEAGEQKGSMDPHVPPGAKR